MVEGRSNMVLIIQLPDIYAIGGMTSEVVWPMGTGNTIMKRYQDGGNKRCL